MPESLNPELVKIGLLRGLLGLREDGHTAWQDRADGFQELKQICGFLHRHNDKKVAGWSAFIREFHRAAGTYHRHLQRFTMFGDPPDEHTELLTFPKKPHVGESEQQKSSNRLKYDRQVFDYWLMVLRRHGCFDGPTSNDAFYVGEGAEAAELPKWEDLLDEFPITSAGVLYILCRRSADFCRMVESFLQTYPAPVEKLIRAGETPNYGCELAADGENRRVMWRGAPLEINART